MQQWTSHMVTGHLNKGYTYHIRAVWRDYEHSRDLVPHVEIFKDGHSIGVSWKGTKALPVNIDNLGHPHIKPDALPIKTNGLGRPTCLFADIRIEEWIYMRVDKPAIEHLQIHEPGKDIVILTDIPLRN